MSGMEPKEFLERGQSAEREPADALTDARFFADIAAEIDKLRARAAERRRKAAIAMLGDDPLAASNLLLQRLEAAAQAARWLQSVKRKPGEKV